MLNLDIPTTLVVVGAIRRGRDVYGIKVQNFRSELKFIAVGLIKSFVYSLQEKAKVELLPNSRISLMSRFIVIGAEEARTGQQVDQMKDIGYYFCGGMHI